MTPRRHCCRRDIERIAGATICRLCEVLLPATIHLAKAFLLDQELEYGWLGAMLAMSKGKDKDHGSKQHSQRHFASDLG